MVELEEDHGQAWLVSGFDTPLGPFFVVHCEPTTVVAAEFGALPTGSSWFGRPLQATPPEAWLRSLVKEALSRTLTCPWRLLDPGLTPLQHQAINAALTIPFGTVAAYGDVATVMGHPRAARLVGQAMSRSPASLFIPTHRVVRADGRPAPCQRGGISARLRAYEGSVRARGR
jgi:O-6-methylguanine DNA methyltransferase